MLSALHLALYTALALVLLTYGGNAFCRWILRQAGMQTTSSPDPVQPVKAGRIIGSLERLIISVGLAAGSWEVVAAVIALKTVARFKELDDKQFAEYFLIGSLSSLFWASAVTGGWVVYDAVVGVDVRMQIVDLVDPPEPEQLPRAQLI